jgi:putative transcriptional regulator
MGNPMALIKTRLRVLRAEREWSQAKLATQLGVSRQTINSIEKGKYHPNLRLAFKIARAFGKQIEDVFPTKKIEAIEPLDSIILEVG